MNKKIEFIYILKEFRKICGELILFGYIPRDIEILAEKYNILLKYAKNINFLKEDSLININPKNTTINEIEINIVLLITHIF